MTVSTPMLVTFCIYILGMLLIGFLAWRSTKSFDDYILGGRSLGAVVTALSAGASDMSGWLLMGLPGAVFISGISESWIAIGLTLGAWLNWKIVAGRLRVHTEHHNNALTLPDFFASRFEDHNKILRVISALVILVFFTIYCASGIVAGARLFETTFGMSYQTALWAGAAATIIYTFIGGFLAISWTDTVQASLMIFALILTPVIVIIAVGGFSDSLQVITASSAANLDMLKNLNFVAILSLLGWGLGYFGQPHILARFMAADSHHSIRRARRIGMSWMTLCLLGAVAVGFFGIAFFKNNPQLAGNVSENGERVFIELARLLFNPWLAGILLSAILAAVMSTLSCQLLVCSSALTEDLYKPFLRMNASQRELVWVGRIMVLLVAIIAIWLASNPQNRVLGLVSYAWAGFGAAFGPVVIFSLIWPRMTRNGALAGMVVGAATVLIWKQYNWLGLYEIIPGFLLASLAIVTVSLLGKAPSAEARQRFELARNEYHAG
ncbi:sodium/proline symporter [Erwinia sp. OLTSP20]|uniref:sodium/proline symporter PutP n=1 Tax=unclassified Erwinia TaxID=2622719 RepID=UPI000C1A2323|nr:MULTISPECIES: sodium/proline symporter PutP [unclassified Erwinia]PIJ48346.1 sodium/proline symporter [Erwinia sp. OAMSP11]PIJ68699.1 sodium/proline symporter [Erwinia sp. OLSSP12]PIJ78847.1 sodium/proline symporter [Erwinia sp. OLCASP19]PIJ79817.1 sodium/proline symporter [Erwinia sp. OLMTSP26]PIJ81222.1 sodium/proline symporter [Erwinia sp. OLMDSP33]